MNGTIARHAPSASPEDWKLPPGRIDWLLGPGTEPSERHLVRATVAATGIGLWSWLAIAGPAWRWWHHLLVAVLVIDVAGGVTANALGTAKRLFHGPGPTRLSTTGRIARHHLAFTAAHVHPIVVGVLYPGGNRWWGPTWYLLALVGVAAVEAVPQHLKRPTGFAVAAAATPLVGAIAAPVGMEWLTVALILKLVLAHAIPEHPYRPRSRIEAVASHGCDRPDHA